VGHVNLENDLTRDAQSKFLKDSIAKRSSERPPRTILRDRYVLLEQLGAGGMGIVYKALDRDVADGKRYGPIHIALKIVDEQKQGWPEAIEAIKHEGSVVFKLRHKNIVEMYSAECDGEIWFLTMELLEGETFESVIERYPNGVPKAECLPLISQLCAAISYAYNEQRIIHSDLKPSNVFITRQKIVKVFDFGIASRVREIGEPQTRFDPKRWGALTPAYACMEMWSGVSADPRDDIYSLGCIVYQLLCGKHPFDGATAVRVYETGMRVAPISGLSRRQNAALKHALSLHRETRTPSVEQFQAEFSSSPSVARYALSAVLACVLVGAIIATVLLVPWPRNAPAPTRTSAPASTQTSAPASTQTSAPASTRASAPASTRASAPAPTQTSPPLHTENSASAPTRIPAPEDRAGPISVENRKEIPKTEKATPANAPGVVAPTPSTASKNTPLTVPDKTAPASSVGQTPVPSTQSPKPLPNSANGVKLPTQESATQSSPKSASTTKPPSAVTKKPSNDLCKTITARAELGETPNEQDRAYLEANCR
jgi:serine/threonine protein kinase